jgi:hypothetical protein
LQAFEEKYTPQVLKDVAAHLDEKMENSGGLKTGQHGDFVITKSPTKTQVNNTDKDSKAE